MLGEQRTSSSHSHTSGKLLQHGSILPHQSDWDVLTSQGAMAGLAVKGCTRAVLSCTCSTAGFQNSRNEVQALLAEAFGNSNVWSQHVTKGIINVLYSITPFVTFWNQSQSPFGWLRSRASDFPARWYPEAPKAKKSCDQLLIVRTWWMSSAKTQFFLKGAFRASNAKTNMTNGIQLLPFCIQDRFDITTCGHS